MKIISLSAENIKKLVAVQITPDGNLVQITGKNGAGKTSVLDCIWWALAGAGKIQKLPVRTGTNEARIKLDLGEIIVTRTFKRALNESATTSIKVTNADGARFPTPQKMLDDLLGSLSFDPLAFARMKPREQFDELKKFVPDVDFDGIEAKNQLDYDTRTAINRKWKEAEAVVKEIKIPTDTPKDRIDEQTLLREMTEASTHNSATDIRKSRRERMAKDIKNYREQAQKLIDEADHLQKQLDEAPPLPEIIDLKNLQRQIEQARESNKILELIDQREEKRAIIDSLETESAKLTHQIEERNAKKRLAIAAAKLPVDGISFGENEILLNDLPFNQASDAEKLRTSLAIAMAANPKLRVIRVRDGSLLDEDSLKLISEMANLHDHQVWIERVDDTGKIGFVLKDGHVEKGAE